MEIPGQQIERNERILFIDSSKLCFMSVLLHNGNDLHSIQIAHFYFLYPVVYHVKNVYLGAISTTIDYKPTLK